ncbi:MAG TPA: UDP-N-acetylglucosamine--N-acetylmuramyl-(pentapeptide) pyrophosphoryl-undecaprenol N-acetylglucosamine transferase, partial [Chloroflexota bacterium]|nr:UDP-N-acetylglucosamine--N-acetylmuramyl-(pentapeptide) pyrophosphoryl-undecaprenol N-acetylglucosamine transferase [Chloroflexota bacterium]
MTLRIATPDTPAHIARSMLDLFLATATCLQRFRRFKPQVVLSTGGFVSIPAMLAAWATRTPVILFLPDVLPGRTVRVFSRIASRIAVSSSDSLTHLPSNGKTVVTGYPVRDQFTAILRADARRDAGLAETDLQLLVMGGSLGAAAINRAIGDGLLELLPLARIVHICGRAHMAEMAAIRDSLSEEQRDRYRLYDYLDSEAMATVLVASDLAITRGGASILGELPATGVPAIVVPFPAAQVGQEANARALARTGGCEVISNES